MAISAVGNDQNQNALLLKDRYANEQQERSFAGMLGKGADEFQLPQNTVVIQGGPEQLPFDPVPFPPALDPMEQGQMGPQHEGVRRPLGAEGGNGGEQLREEAADLRAQAEDLRTQADEVEAENPQLAQRMRDRADMLDQRAIALDQRADTVAEREEIAMDRERIEAEGNALNGGDDYSAEGPEKGYQEHIVGYPAAGREDNAVAKAGWVDERELEIYATALADIPEFPNLEISAAREANEAEVDVFLDVAEADGATPEDLELIEGFVEVFPVQFVFVDNLIDDYGVETASGGAVTVEGTTTILIDSDFKDNNFTQVGEYETQEGNDAGLDVVEFSYASVLEIFDLPGAPADSGIAETAPFVSMTSTVPTVDESGEDQGVILDENDEANAEATAAVSGAGDFDADE